MRTLMLTPNNHIYTLDKTYEEIDNSFSLICDNYYVPWDRHLIICFEDDFDESFDYDKLLNNEFGENALCKSLRPNHKHANYYVYAYVIRVDDDENMLDLTDYNIEAIHTYLFESGNKFITDNVEFAFDKLQIPAHLSLFSAIS